MDFKVEIKCAVCCCKFELRPGDFKSREALECPNCGQPFPGDVYRDLKSGVLSLGSVPETLPPGETDLLVKKAFSLQVKQYSLVDEVLRKD